MWFLKNFYGFWQITALNFWPILHFNSYASPSFYSHADRDASSLLDIFCGLLENPRRSIWKNFPCSNLREIFEIRLDAFSRNPSCGHGWKSVFLNEVWKSFPGKFSRIFYKAFFCCHHGRKSRIIFKNSKNWKKPQKLDFCIT